MSTDYTQVLALTGGGFKGFYTAHVLAGLESAAQQPIGRCFDLIAGTSIGGILALAIAFEVPMQSVVDVFEENGERIFKRKKLSGWINAKYENKELRDTIASILPEGATLGDAAHAVLVPAVNMTHGKPQVFKTRHHQSFNRDYRYLASDVALATSAAPTYFPIATVDGQLYADGGLFANAPDLLATHEVEKFFGVPLSSTRVLSIGTTTSSYSLPHGLGLSFGIKQWMEKKRLLLETIMSSQQQLALQVVAHQLGSRHIRIDNHPPENVAANFGLDSANQVAREQLAGLAKKDVSDALGKQEVRDFLSHHPRTWIIKEG